MIVLIIVGSIVGVLALIGAGMVVVDHIKYRPRKKK